jgi:3',5'-cyclic AMP phosphodiesterase CpdA
MDKLTRRRFIKQIGAASAGAAIFPLLLKVYGEDEGVISEDNHLILTSPCLVKPAISSITINIVGGDKPCEAFIRYMESGSGDSQWMKSETFTLNPYTPVNITLNHLKTGISYKYQVLARFNRSDEFKPVANGSFSTQKIGNIPFSFAMLSDSHITINEPERIQILSDIAKSILARRPDFLMMLGDNIQTFTSHGGPMTEERFGPALYYRLKQGLDNLPSSVPVYTLIGNWEGENGWHHEEQRGWARNTRLAWMPNPLPDTYPEGGGEYGDYFGFTWGNALFISLTVTGYTTIEHIHGSKVGRGDDWTLGDKQKEWLYKQLSESKAKWKFIFIHHTVSGNAGDDINTRYGRGGGLAAKIGEQKVIHEWMKKFNVKALFYGHDHVFTDIPVDGIHYTCVGSAGAPWKFTTEETGYTKYWPDSGYTWVDVNDNKVKVSFIRPDKVKPEGEVLHQFKIS